MSRKAELAIRAALDQERAEARDWMQGSDPESLATFRFMLGAEDSAAMLAKLPPALADIVARLAIIAFDEIAMSSGMTMQEGS